MEKKSFVIGIDVSKDKLDVYFQATGSHFILPNSSDGFASLFEAVIKDAKCDLTEVLICFENTGKYSKELSVFLSEHNVRFNMSPALAIKRSLGLVRGKDDKIDSKRIALYAYEKQETLPLTKISGYEIAQVKALLNLRDKLIRHRTAYKNGISDLKDSYKDGETLYIRDVQEKLILQITEQIEGIEDQVMQIVKSDASMLKNYNLMLSIKGVGMVTALYFIAYTNNFKTFSNWRAFACYSGIAPFPYSSGKMIGKNRVHDFANKKMKSILDLAAKSTIRYNGEFKAYYDRRVIEMGKSKMSTINIIRNKIVARVFAVINRGTPYVDLYKFVA